MRFIIRHVSEARTLTCDFCKQVFVIPPDTDDVHVQRSAARHLEVDHGATRVGSAHLMTGGEEGTQVMEIQAEVPSAIIVEESAAADDAGDEGIEQPDVDEPPVERPRRRSR